MIITTADLSVFLNLMPEGDAERFPETDDQYLDAIREAAEDYVRAFLAEPYRSAVGVVTNVGTETEPEFVLTFNTGGSDPQPFDMPEPIRHAVRLVGSHLYEAREVVTIGAPIREMPLGVAELLLPYRGFTF
ncbi:head-tail connector protein [Alsobacter sp. R-9]